MKVFLLLALLLLPAYASATDRYVRNSCSNGINTYNPVADACITGSSLVYNSIANGISAMAPGDTLYIRSGTYAVTISDSQFAGKSGTSYAAATKIRAYGTELVTINNISFAGAPGVNTSYVIFEADPTAHNFRVQNINVGQAGNTGLAQFIKFDGLEVVGSSTEAVIVGESASSDIWFTHMKVSAPSTCNTGGPGPHGFYIQGPNVIVENSEVFSVAGYGIHNYDQVGGRASNNIYRNNTIHNTGGNQGACPQSTFGIGIVTGTNNLVYNNVLYNNQNGMDIPASGTKVYNNTLYQNGVGYPGGLIYPAIKDNAGSGQFIRNNLLVSNQNNSIDISGSSATTSNNITSTSPATYFVNAGANNFNLVSTATLAIDQGVANIAPGVTIPACSGGGTTNCYNGVAPDIGALETGVPTAGGGPPILTANPSTVTTGAAMSVTVDDDDVKERIEDVGDWVGIFAPGLPVPAGGVIDGLALFDWFYMNGTKTAPLTPISDAVIKFTAPASPGTYEFRFYQNGSNLEIDRLATAPFTVTAPGIVMKFNISSLKIGPSVTLKIGTP